MDWQLIVAILTLIVTTIGIVLGVKSKKSKKNTNIDVNINVKGKGNNVETTIKK